MGSLQAGDSSWHFSAVRPTTRQLFGESGPIVNIAGRPSLRGAAGEMLEAGGESPHPCRAGARSPVRVAMATSLLFSRGDIIPLARCANMRQSVSHARTFVPKMLSRFGAGGALTLRVLGVLYVVQAAIGITAGIAYAVRLLYW
jgi:hypothetical protein